MGNDFCRGCKNENISNCCGKETINEEYNLTKNKNDSYLEYQNNYNTSELTKNNEDCNPVDLKTLMKTNKRLEEITKINSLNKIIKVIRQFKKLRNIAHQKINFESNLEMASKYFTVKGEEDIDVDLFPSVSYSYYGQKFKEQKDGYGMEIFDKGVYYFGTFSFGKRIKVGKFINEKVGYSYEGEIDGNLAKGFGKYNNTKIGITYLGEWIDNRKYGIALETYSDGSYYEGQYKLGLKNGIGIYQWNDGSKYKGEWTDNKLEGYGIYYFKDGSIYTGEWKNSQMNGFGKFEFPEKKIFVGMFKNDKKDGIGFIYWKEHKKMFIGYFTENKQNGHGKIAFENGTEKYGEWILGKKKEQYTNFNDFLMNLTSQELNCENYFKKNYNELLDFIKSF